MAVKREQLPAIFTYHAPDTTTAEGLKQVQGYKAIRALGEDLAAAILEYTPVCGDQQAAIRKVREAVMTANAAIALQGLV